MTDRPEVLFLCVHNAGRSQMAAAFAREFGGDRVVVHSAGSAPGESLNPAVVQVMKEKGIDISNEAPRKLTDQMDSTPTSLSRWVVGTRVPCTRASGIWTGT